MKYERIKGEWCCPICEQYWNEIEYDGTCVVCGTKLADVPAEGKSASQEGK